MKYVIGIDGGGTKTLLRAADLDGNMLAEATGGAVNLCAVSQESVKAVLCKLFAQIAPLGTPEAICIGSAGILVNENREFFIRTLSELSGCDTILTASDSYIALYANLENEAGISLTAGTGSICCGKNESGEFHRVGGWGHICSDEGSAYAIAVAGIAAAFRHADGREKTVLYDELCRETGATSPSELTAYVYIKAQTKPKIAALCPVVTRAAEAGDESALRIVQNAAHDLYALVAANAKILKLTDFKVILNGGVLTKCKLIHEQFCRLIKESFPTAICQNPTRDAAWGAVSLALDAPLGRELRIRKSQ